jgi:hypothetical protein
MSNKKTTTDSFFEEIWGRIKSETQVKSMISLAKTAGTTQQNVSKKKKEKKFPIEWAYKVAQQYGLLTEWIMTGEGPKRIAESATTPDQEENTKGIIEEWVQEVREKEGNDGRIVMELALQVQEFREWYKEKKSKSGGAEIGSPHENVA